jgi:hypothetical protein
VAKLLIHFISNPLIRFWKDQDELVLPDRLEDVQETLEMGRRQQVSGRVIRSISSGSPVSMRQVFNQDPVRRIPLKEFIGQKMAQAHAAATANGVDFQAALAKVDQTTMESLQKELS